MTVNHVHATPAPTATPMPDAGAQATPAPSPTAVAPAAAAPDRCHAGGLLISFAGSEGAAGTIYDTFRVANTRSSSCYLYGYVGMLMLDASGAPLPTRVVRNGSQAGPSRFLLQPGTAASFQASWSDVTHGSAAPCPQAARLEMRWPDSRQ